MNNTLVFGITTPSASFFPRVVLLSMFKTQVVSPEFCSHLYRWDRLSLFSHFSSSLCTASEGWTMINTEKKTILFLFFFLCQLNNVALLSWSILCSCLCLTLAVFGNVCAPSRLPLPPLLCALLCLSLCASVEFGAPLQAERGGGRSHEDRGSRGRRGIGWHIGGRG